MQGELSSWRHNRKRKRLLIYIRVASKISNRSQWKSEEERLNTVAPGRTWWHLPPVPFFDRYQMATSAWKQDLMHHGERCRLHSGGTKGKAKQLGPGNIQSSHWALHTVQGLAQTTLDNKGIARCFHHAPLSKEQGSRTLRNVTVTVVIGALEMHDGHFKLQTPAFINHTT